MSNVLNLLPEDRLRLQRRAYWLRVLNAGLVLVSIGVVLGGIFLLPNQVRTKSAYDAVVGELSQFGISSAPSVATAADGAEGNTVYEALRRAQLASPLLRELLAVPRDGVVVAKLQYVLGGQQKVEVSAKARTRDQLDAFVKNLQAVPKVASVQLPVSAYAKESDLPFTLTITLKP